MSSPRQPPIGVGIVGLFARRGWASRAHLTRVARFGREGPQLRVTARGCDIDILQQLVTSYNERLPCELPARGGIVGWRVHLYLLQHDLDSWEQELSNLGPGQTVSIGGDRGLSLDIHVHEGGWLSIQVSDPDRLTTALGTRPQEDWIAEHRGRLEQVRLTWPSEVIETAPGAYEWSPTTLSASSDAHLPGPRFPGSRWPVIQRRRALGVDDSHPENIKAPSSYVQDVSPRGSSLETKKASKAPIAQAFGSG